MWSSLALNTLGGILAGLAFSLSAWLRRRLAAWQFKQVFGPGVASEEFTLVYEELSLKSPSPPYPYQKPGGNPQFGFSISHPIPVASVRSISYLASSIGSRVAKSPAVRSDLQTRATLDLDYVSFGGPGSNFKTEDCQTNSANRLAAFDQAKNTFIRLSDGQPLAQLEPGFDYGLILKVRPSQFPQRVWLLCAGLGEYGTSGAAWFLANRWQDIRKQVGSQPFAVLVKVRPGQDQSAEPVGPAVF